MKKIKLLVFLLFTVGICVGLPVQDKKSDESTVEIKDANETVQENAAEIMRRPPFGCIPTPWGCIDPTDPSFRPRSMVNESAAVEVEGQEVKEVAAEVRRPIGCIVTAWGCIDLSDPAFRPRSMINKTESAPKNQEVIAEVARKPVSCIQTPWGCIDVSNPPFRPRLMGDQRKFGECDCIVTWFRCIGPCNPGFHPEQDDLKLNK